MNNTNKKHNSYFITLTINLFSMTKTCHCLSSLVGVKIKLSLRMDANLRAAGAKNRYLCCRSLLLLLVCVSFTIIGQPRNSVLIRRV